MNASTPASAFFHGSRVPLMAFWMVCAASDSIRSKTASNSACLPEKWW